MPAEKDLAMVTDHVTQSGIDTYAELSGDFNPLHVDPAVAAASEFGGVIAHGPVALQVFFRWATATFDRKALGPGSEVRVAYRGPTRPGDTLRCVPREESPVSGGLQVKADCVNQDDTVVVSVDAIVVRPDAG